MRKLALIAFGALVTMILISAYRHLDEANRYGGASSRLLNSMNGVKECVFAFVEKGGEFPRDLSAVEGCVLDVTGAKDLNALTNDFVYLRPIGDQETDVPVVLQRLGIEEDAALLAYALESSGALFLFDESNGNYSDYLETHEIDDSIVRWLLQESFAGYE